jgi:FkbM family methyltransferase
MPRLDRASLTAATVGVLARRTPWLEPELTGLSELVRPGDVCVDVGAAAGLYTVLLSELAGPGGQVHSIEPLRFAHPLWTRLLRAGESGNVRHYALALGTEPGEARMSVPIGRYGLVTGRSFLEWKTNGIGSNAEFDGQVEVIVEVDTLDALCARAAMSRLDFVKIDVEGGELNVLRGGQHVIEKYRPTMLIEIEERHITRYQHSAADVVDWLTERGYTMSVWQEGWRATGGVRADVRNYLFRAQ